MADYTPTTDVFGKFIEGLKMGQSIKERKAKEQALAAENALKADINRLNELRLGMDISRASGGEYTGVEDYETGLKAYADYVKNAPVRSQKDVLGGYQAPPLNPLKPGSTTEPMTTFEGSAASQIPAVPYGTGTIPRQESPQAYSQPEVSEEQIQQAIPNLVGANDEDIARFMRGHKNISTSMGPLLTDPNTGGTMQVYSPSVGKTAISRGNKSSAGQPGGRSYVDPAHIEAIVDAAHTGSFDIKSATSKYQSAAVYGRWLVKYPEDTPKILEMQAKTGFRMQPKTQQTVSIIASLLQPTPRPDGGIDPSLFDQLKSEHAFIRQAGGNVWSKGVNTANLWLKENQRNPHVSAAKQLQTALANEVASAFSAGGVPTDIRFKNEIENIDLTLSPEAFATSLDASVAALTARTFQFTNTKNPNVKGKDTSTWTDFDPNKDYTK